MKLLTTGVLLIWIGTGVINFGATNGDFRASFSAIRNDTVEARKNCGFAALYGVMGPLALLPVAAMSGFYVHGLSFDCGVSP